MTNDALYDKREAVPLFNEMPAPKECVRIGIAYNEYTDAWWIIANDQAAMLTLPTEATDLLLEALGKLDA